MSNIFIAAKKKFAEFGIEKLKKQLAETDYKDTKNAGAFFADMPLPYEPVALYTERQAIRDKINELEAVISDS